MPTEYAPTATWHPTITCVAAGDYQRPQSIVAGLEDLADNAQSLKNTLQGYLETFAVVRSYTDLLTLDPSTTNLVTVQLPGTEFYALYRFISGSAQNQLAPWQLPCHPGFVGHWQMLGPPVDDYTSGVVCYGPRYTGDPTPAGRAPVMRLQGCLLHAAKLTLAGGATSISATNGATTIPSMVADSVVAQVGDVIEGTIGPLWVSKSETTTNGAQLEVRLYSVIPGGSTTETTATFVILDDATLANGGGYLTVPFTLPVPLTAYQSIQLILTGPSTGTVTLTARNTTSGVGTWRVSQGVVL